MLLLQSWSNKRTCHRQELESLIGHLHHACKVVRPGRTFLRRMIDLLAHFRNRSHPIRLNVEFRRHIHCWLAFFRDWNGISFFLSPGVSQLPDLFVASDAAGPSALELCSVPIGVSVPGRSCPPHNTSRLWSFCLSL